MNENDQNTIHRVNYNFFVIWTIPTDELADAVQKLMLSEGWFNYFDHLNLKGGSTDIFEKLINIKCKNSALHMGVHFAAALSEASNCCQHFAEHWLNKLVMSSLQKVLFIL